MTDAVSLILDSTGVAVAAAMGVPADVPVESGQVAVLFDKAAADAGAWVGSTRQADGSWLPPGGPVPPPTKAELVAYAAARRYAVETGGVIVLGMTVLTDRISQGLIDRAVSLAERDPGEPADFKAASGWVTLDGPTMLQIGLAVGRHVRTSFRRERAADAAIQAGTATTLADVEVIVAGK
jgi:hypothetical protein